VTVVRWVRAEKADGLTELSFGQAASASGEGGEAPLPQEREVDAQYEAWRVARIKDRQQELEEYARTPFSATDPNHAHKTHASTREDVDASRPAWTAQGAAGATGTG